MKWAVGSCMVYIVPAILSITYEIFWLASIILIVTLTSLIYHASHEKRFKKIDGFFALLLMGANLYLLYRIEFNMLYTSLALYFCAVAFYFQMREERNYDFNHAMWHVSSAVVIVACILGYGRVTGIIS